MRFSGKILGLLLASAGLASCGGGGGNGGAYSPPQNSKMELSAYPTTTLPVNVWGYPPTQYGNPTQAEVTITWRNPNGSLVNGQDIHVSIAPTNVAVLSCLVDGDECKDGNALFGSVVIKGMNGQATIFVNSFTSTGTAKLTVSGTDPNTNQSVSASMNFTVVTGVGPEPANIELSANPGRIYTSGAAGSSAISAIVTDGGGQLVPDPMSGNTGHNNIRFEVVGGASRGALSANSAGGAASGASINTYTVHGVANASFAPGTELGPVQIKATVDRADGNVDDGISDPLSVTTTVVVSDGELYRLVITSPTTNAIAVNPVSGNVHAPVDEEGNLIVPVDPDGSYSLTVSALATDRQGNPVPPGTNIEFGVVDAPMMGFPELGSGFFQIAGLDGNPKESGTLFTAPLGAFRTAGGGAGPGDTLLVFGQLVTGNADLESARRVATVNSETSLNVTYRFNPNDTTGQSVDYGSVLPYVIGRAAEGNIGASAVTDVNGVASTTLNYPVSRLGKGALIWARGTGAPVDGTPRLITDISGGGFPGVAPGQLVVNQTPLPGNTQVYVEVCLFDALGSPIQGSFIGFSFVELGVGTGSIDGHSGSGTFDHPTGSGGCTSGLMQTVGIADAEGGEEDSGPRVIFNAGPSVPVLPVPIVASGSLVLQASPSSLDGSGGRVTLRVTDSSGNPVNSVAIAADCSAGASASLIAPTNDQGETSVTITANLSGYKPDPKTATCTFTVAAGGASATVNLQGTDYCDIDPENVLCGGEQELATVLVGMQSSGGTNRDASLSSVPGGIFCSMSDSPSQTCSFDLAPGTTYTLIASPAPTGWSGNCVAVTTPPPAAGTGAASMQIADGASCTAIYP